MFKINLNKNKLFSNESKYELKSKYTLSLF